MVENGKKEKLRLDEVNRKRVETTKLRVAHALRLLSCPIDCLKEGRVIDGCIDSIAHAVNLLEAGNEEMRWACKHFEWNSDVCDCIDDACGKLGIAIAGLLDDEDPDAVACDTTEAAALLGKALAALVRWFAEDQDVSEV